MVVEEIVTRVATESCFSQCTETQLKTYRGVLEEATSRRIPFAVGGSAALALYCKIVRPIKDLDLYIKPEHAPAMIDVVKQIGLRDYYDQLPYDRGWIYRASSDDVIVDVIWQMANRRTQVDDEWLTHGQEIQIAGQTARLMPLEELIWSKIYVLQRDRSDWPDILNIIDMTADQIDWRRLVSRVGDDTPLLFALLQIYAWLCPETAGRFPEWLQREMRLHNIRRRDGIELTRQRAALLDSRNWLTSLSREQRCS